MTIKTCAECRYMEDPGIYAKCRAPENVSPRSIPTGFPAPQFNYCEEAREFSSACGPEALWWAAVIDQ